MAEQAEPEPPIFHRIAHLFPRVRGAYQEYAAALRADYRAAEAIQRDCPHERTQYNADPCHTDSFTRCLECGAEKGRRGQWEVAPGILGKGERG